MISYWTNLFKAIIGSGLKDKSVPTPITGLPNPIPENKNEDIWGVIQSRTNADNLIANPENPKNNSPSTNEFIETFKQGVKDFFETKNESTKEFIESKKTEVNEFIVIKKEGVKEFFEVSTVDIREFFESKTTSINEMPVSREDKEAIQHFIEVKRTDIKEDVDLKKDELKEYFATKKDALQEYITSKKEHLQEYLMTQKEYIVDLVSTKKDKENIKEFIEMKKGEILEYITFKKQDIKESVILKKEAITELVATKKMAARDFIESRKENIVEFIEAKRRNGNTPETKDNNNKSDERPTINIKDENTNIAEVKPPTPDVKPTTPEIKPPKNRIDKNPSHLDDSFGNLSGRHLPLSGKIDFSDLISQEQPRTPNPIDESIVTPSKEISLYNRSIDSTSVAIVDVAKEKEVKQILFAEDDLLLRKSLSFYLSESGYKIIQAENGVEAVEQIKKNKFDLMIIDLNMPFIGGMEIINMVHNELKLATPIIVLTSSGVEEVELESFTMGANEFISKPFSPSVLKARMDKLIAKFAT
ncbi:MAG: response regulator transcription factor [Chitinophagaceae bacterium]